MSAPGKKPYLLPRQVDALLGSAARLLKEQGEDELVSLLANARIELEEETEYDNFDGGQTGHLVRLCVPESLFHPALPRVNDLRTKLREVINQLAAVPGEYISEVAIALDATTTPANWREQSGALLSPPTLNTATDSDRARLWGEGTPRVFVSHRADFKRQAHDLKRELAEYGIAPFVAHDDIEPTRAWQQEIERALATMDVIVALLSDGFSASHWTNQEIGIGLGRGVPIVSVKITEDPRGFIGSTQAISGRNRGAAKWAKAVVSAFSAYPRLSAALLGGLVHRWESAENFIEAIRVMNLLDSCDSMPADLLVRIERAHDANDQLNGSVGVAGKYPAFLKRMKAGAKGKR